MVNITIETEPVIWNIKFEEPEWTDKVPIATVDSVWKENQYSDTSSKQS